MNARRRRHASERGAVLIMAIGFVVMIGAIGAGLAALIISSNGTGLTIEAVRKREYAADGDIQAAVAYYRTLSPTAMNTTTCGWLSVASNAPVAPNGPSRSPMASPLAQLGRNLDTTQGVRLVRATAPAGARWELVAGVPMRYPSKPGPTTTTTTTTTTLPPTTTIKPTTTTAATTTTSGATTTSSVTTTTVAGTTTTTVAYNGPALPLLNKVPIRVDCLPAAGVSPSGDSLVVSQRNMIFVACPNLGSPCADSAIIIRAEVVFEPYDGPVNKTYVQSWSVNR
jgi:hypothetical protein